MTVTGARRRECCWSAAPRRSGWRSCGGWPPTGRSSPILLGRDRRAARGGRSRSLRAARSRDGGDRGGGRRRPRRRTSARSARRSAPRAASTWWCWRSACSGPGRPRRRPGRGRRGHAGQLPRRRLAAARLPAPAARAGQRNADRALDRRRRAPAGEQRDLRRRQGGARRAGPGPRRRRGRQRRARAGGPPRVRHDADDRGAAEPAPFATTAEAVADGDRRGARQAGRTRSGCPGTCATCSPCCATCPDRYSGGCRCETEARRASTSIVAVVHRRRSC